MSTPTRTTHGCWNACGKNSRPHSAHSDQTRSTRSPSSDLTSVTSEEMAEAVLEPAPCLRLLALRYTAHEYITGVRQGQEPEFPTVEPTWLVVSRRDYVVRRCAVSEAEYVLLSAIVSGSTLGAAIAAVSATTAMDSDQLAASLRDWFCRWAAAAWFSGIRIRRQEPA